MEKFYIFEYKGKAVSEYHGIDQKQAHFIAQGICIGMRTLGRKNTELKVYTQDEGKGEETKSLLYVQR